MARLASFRSFVNPGRCIMAYASNETNRKLEEFYRSLGVFRNFSWDGTPLKKPFEFHVTIIFTKTPVDIPLGEFEITPTEVYPKGYEIFGENNDIPVLIVDGRNLEPFRKTYKELYSFHEEFPTWKAHISLSYDKNQVDIMQLTLPDFPIILDKMKVDVAN